MGGGSSGAQSEHTSQSLQVEQCQSSRRCRFCRGLRQLHKGPSQKRSSPSSAVASWGGSSACPIGQRNTRERLEDIEGLGEVCRASRGRLILVGGVLRGAALPMPSWHRSVAARCAADGGSRCARLSSFSSRRDSCIFRPSKAAFWSLSSLLRSSSSLEGGGTARIGVAATLRPWAWWPAPRTVIACTTADAGTQRV